MLVLPKQRASILNDEANVFERLRSSPFLAQEQYNEVQISKEERQTKAYTQKYLDNLKAQEEK